MNLQADLIIMRHAVALSSEVAGVEFDAQRPLAADGQESARKLGRILAGVGLTPQACTCSPFVRARETAELVLEAAGSSDVPELATALAPGCGIEDLLQAAGADTDGPLLVVIHEPDVSRLLSMVLGSPWPYAVLPGDCFVIRVTDGNAGLVASFSPERGRGEGAEQ